MTPGVLKWSSDVFKPQRASSPRTWTPERQQALKDHLAAGGTLRGERGFEGNQSNYLARDMRTYGIESPGVYKGGRKPIHGEDVVKTITDLILQGKMPAEIAPVVGLSREQVKSFYKSRVNPNL